ncbi:hypothetical protein OAM01_01830 [bacterium]|nr:hypothetical protein [bacterium]
MGTNEPLAASAKLMGQPELIEFRSGGYVSDVLVSVKKGWVNSKSIELDIEITGLNGGFSHHGKQIIPLTSTSVFSTDKDVAYVIVNWTADEIPRHVNETYTVCIQVLVDGKPLGVLKCTDFGPF